MIHVLLFMALLLAEHADARGARLPSPEPWGEIFQDYRDSSMPHLCCQSHAIIGCMSLKAD
jgi:hypothetical protein